MSQESSKPDSNAPQVDLSGQRLGDFQLLRRLGRGAMAEVYLAEQSSLGRRVAIKVLKPDLAGDSTYLARFQREAQAAAALVHANIVQIYEVGQRDAYHYIAQEYVEGQNLREWIARNGPPEPAVALSIMLQAAAALAKAGEQGIVHRDIKPENILLTRSGEVKVADFGLARFAREESLDLTQVGVTLGTPLYMSPEQVEGRTLDPRSDIYSLGVTYYHMLVGTPPFLGETALGVAVQHLKKEPKALDELRPDLPPAFSRVVHKMLAKEPAARYPSALELLRELRRLQQELFADTWPEDLPGCDLFVTGLTGQSGPSITRQLEQSMQAAAVCSAATSPRRPWLWALAYAASFAAGLVLARFTAGAPLLPTKPASRFVSRQPTPLAQIYLACQLGTEDAWQSVEKYYPSNHSLVRRAKQQLARLYLRESRYDEALAIFEQFASTGPSDEYRVFGLAGKAAILTLRKQYHDSARVLETLWPMRDKLRDLQMQQLVQTVLKKNRAEVGPNPSHAEWQKWLDDRFGEPE
jgi:tRNA A-37 threonylcarbamoyl transferase component Bud32